MIHYLLINNNSGKTIATASSMDVVEQYIADVANHQRYFLRKRVLELARRENNKKNRVTHSVNLVKVASKELQDLKEIIRQKPQLKSFLESEVNRLTKLVAEEKALVEYRLTETAEAKSKIEQAWFNTLSDEDKMIWEGNWDHAKDNSVPSYKPVQFLG